MPIDVIKLDVALEGLELTMDQVSQMLIMAENTEEITRS